MAMRKKSLTGFALLLLTSACTVPQAPVTHMTADQAANDDVNPGYASGQVVTPDKKVPSMQDLQDITAAPKAEGATAEDRLRAPALRDAALSYGVQGGLAWASRQINEMLEAKAENLTRTYQFNRFLIKGPGGVTILPPVISESRDTYEQSDAGKTLRVADTYYQIISQARFAPVAPLWHTYLIRSYTVPDRPPEMLLPKNAGERDVWRRYVAEGWDQGIRQAQMIFKQDLNRLERDFTGMARYSQLLETHQVTAPIVASQDYGVTGTGEDMRVNDTAMKITADPRLNVQRPSLTPTEAATPPGGSPGVTQY
jgi:defect-in-organelle-trafficking protein DotC